MRGGFLQLSGFALGSNELRCRIVGPGRRALEETTRQNRMVAAAEGATRAGKASAGAGVVSAVAAVIGIAIAHGNTNPAAYRIVNHYNVQNVYVRAPNEAPRVISKDEIEHGRHVRLRKKRIADRNRQVAETEVLTLASEAQQQVNLAGWFQTGPNGAQFRTMSGNVLPVRGWHPDDVRGRPMAIRADVDLSRGELELRVTSIIAELSDM